MKLTAACEISFLGWKRPIFCSALKGGFQVRDFFVRWGTQTDGLVTFTIVRPSPMDLNCE